MKTIVTGSEGFVGQHVVKALKDAGHEVVGVDKATGCDIFNDEVLEMFDTDAVFHLAAEPNPDVIFHAPVDSFLLNVQGTIRTAYAAVQAKARFVFASTVWCYGTNRHLYTTSKRTGEELIRDLNTLYGLEYTILRYGIPYGPGMRKELVIPSMLRRALNNEDVMVMGGKQGRHFIFVEDLAAAHVEILKDEYANKMYALPGSEYITIGRLAEMIIAMTNSNSRIMYARDRVGDYTGDMNFDDSLPEMTHTSFWDGLRITIDWFRERWQ